MPSTNSIQSPCVRNCCLDEQDICLGCFRSLDEILQWGAASEASKLEMLKKASQRKVTLRTQPTHEQLPLIIGPVSTNKIDVHTVTCPYCGESINLLVDCSVSDQHYIEDCQVCCRPINVDVTVDYDGISFVNVSHENE
jgi:predicted Fe-S protein YdhL (DUF1289 family)